MKKQKEKSWRLIVNLKLGSEYQFGYQLNKQKWFNEPEADGYVPNPYGEQNSVGITKVTESCLRPKIVSQLPDREHSLLSNVEQTTSHYDH